MHAINAYWFDVADRLFPPAYEQTCAALIWGGKTDYATWFSAEPEHTHGIILLPIQSGSLYLGLYPDYVKRNLQGLARLRGGTTWKDWHDTLWAYEALGDAENAMRRFEADPGRIGAHAKPFIYHWIANLQVLGHVDREVTADYPTAIAFTRDGQRTYVAYNMTDRPVTVHFSDGATLPVPPNQWVTKP
jgi:endoglucanase Acf2